MTEITIPYQDEDDLVVEIIDAAWKTQTGDELRVTKQLVYDALVRGTTSVGGLLKELEGADARKIVDEARQSLGMKTVGQQEADENFERENANLPPSRDADGRCFQSCAAENCLAYPLNEMGVPIPVVDRIWWCDRHKDQAGPDDHLPPEVKYVLDFATMSPRAVGAERERLLEEDRERERKAAERTRIQREEAERVAKLEAEWQAAHPPVLFGGPPPK